MSGSPADLPNGNAAMLSAVPQRMQGQFVGSQLYLKPVATANGATPDYVLADVNPSLADTGGLAPFATSAPSGLSPARLRHAYGIDNVLFGGVTGDGTGQTIAIIDAYDDPTAASDLQAFDQQFGLPDPPSFTKVNQAGGSTLPGTDPAGKGNDWEVEESLDVEWAHAVAPSANLILVEANSPTESDLITGAVGWARSAPGVSAVSMSFGGSETSSETSLDSTFTTPSGHAGVTFLASTGDSGSPGGYPAYSPNVVAVGGTTLNTDSAGNILSETGWSGSGGGISADETQPAYQKGVVTQSLTSRTIPDVSSDANPSTGVAVYDSYDFGTTTPWIQVGGTSLSAPTWAGLIAIADQGRALSGAGSLDGATQTLPRLYAIPGSTFHDILSGSNGYAAGPGYDLVTGRGSPVANSLLPYFSVPGPYVSSFAPTKLQSAAPSYVDFNFSAPMDPASFSVASDVDAFTGPGNTDLRSSITGYSWSNNNTTLEVDFTPPTAQGPYTMSIGPQILSATGTAMDQNQNGSAGEVPADEFSGTFYYDVTPTQVAYTNPVAGSTVTAPFTTLDLHFSAPYDPTLISPKNLSIDQGSVTAAKVIDATTVQYTLSGVIAGTINVTLAQGALKDTNGNPILAFSASYIVPITMPPASGWGTYQGNTGHTGYVPGTLDPYYFQTLWSTLLPTGSLTDMSVGGGGVYVASDIYSNAGNLFALSTATGNTLWQDALGSFDQTNAPAYSDGQLYLQTTGGTYFWSFNATTGAVNYKTPLSSQGERYLSPTVAYGNVYAEGGTYGGMYSLSASSGAQNWFGTVAQVDSWTPAVNSAYCYAYAGGLIVLNRLTGAMVSKTPDPGYVNNTYSIDEAVALGSDNDALVANNNRVVSFSAQQGGGINWTATDKYTGQVTLAGGVVYVQDGSGIAALSEANGAKLWTWTPAGGSISGRIIATDDMLFASNSTTTYAINLQTQQTAWTVAYGGHLALNGNTLYIASSNGTVTAIGLQYASTVALKMTNGSNPSSADEPLSFTATTTGGNPDGETVMLVDASNNNAVLASGTLTNGSATLTIPAGTLSAGTHSLVAVYGGDANFAASESAPYTQTVEVAVTGVAVNGNNTSLAGVQRSMVDSILYTFSEAVNIAAADAFSIAVNAGQSGTVPSLAWAAINPNSDGSSTQWVVTFSGAGVTGGSIGNGVYDITLNSSAVTSDANPSAIVQARPADTFYRLFGDINGDGRVNNADYAAFLNTNGLKTGQSGFNAAFDANGDGRINNADYALMLTDNGLRYSGFAATV